MTSRRVVIGKYADGVTYGLKIALPGGFDALTLDDNSGSLSFNSNWTDIVNVQQLGFASGSSSGSIPLGVNVSISDPGYVPYVEARIFSGSTINDDDVDGSIKTGVGAYYNQRSPLTLRMPSLGAGQTALFLIYLIPVVLS
jgi:hypothetical protein